MMTREKAREHILILGGWMRAPKNNSCTPAYVELRNEGYDREGWGFKIPCPELVKDEHRDSYNAYMKEHQLIQITPGSPVYISSEK